MSFENPEANKKASLVIETEVTSTGLEENPSLDLVDKYATGQLDPAALFLEKHRDLDVSDIDINKLRHKIDFRVRPVSRNPKSRLTLSLDRTIDVCLLHSCLS